MIRIFAASVVVIVTLVALATVAVADEDERTWVRLRYRISPTENVPSAEYTLIEMLSESASQRARILFTDDAERRLRIDLRVKASRVEDHPDSRWSEFFTVPGGEALAIARVAGQVEIHRGGGLLLTYDGREGLDESGIAQAISLRTALPAELLAALKSFARIGLAREAAFYDEAQILADVLFPEIAGLSLDPSRREQIVSVIGFDPEEHGALDGELPFGPDYDIPGRIRPRAEAQSQTSPEAGEPSDAQGP